MDNLKQLGRNLNQNRYKTNTSLKKGQLIIPQIEKVRDTMDPVVPFEIEFSVTRPGHRILLDIDFMPPPKTGCCSDCTCAVCEFFDGGVSETTFVTTYAYIPGTVHVFKNNNPDEVASTETNPTLGQVTTFALNDDKVIICYLYDICI